MTFFDSLLIFIIVVALYALLVVILHKKGFLTRFGVSLYGPALLLRTKKGRGFLQRIASRKRFWKAFGSFGVVLCFIVMIFITAVLIWQAWTILGFTPAEKAVLPGPEFALILPGINPILPLNYLLYIIIALVVAIVVHEFSHGILTFAGNLNVKSLGILYLIIPVGAFCEPDEDQLRTTRRPVRMRVYAAGPLSNFTVGLICLLLFSFVFMASVTPAAGAEVLYIGSDTPADRAGLQPGNVITSINHTKIENVLDFYNVLQNTSANQTVELTYQTRGVTHTINVTLADKSTYSGNLSQKGQGYLGVGPNIYGGYLTALKDPFRYIPDNFLLLYSLPIFGYFQGYNPIASPFTDAYHINGILGMIPTPLFWGLVNTIYWIFWLNLAVGLFNVLPMIPLDGGFLFNDAVGGLLHRFKKELSDERREQAVRNISLLISLTILFLVIFPWIIKYF
jgi:membrane-associated protease RseP (regulator of RpoE activity)